MSKEIKWRFPQSVAAANISNREFYYTIDKNEIPRLVMTMPDDKHIATIIYDSLDLLGIGIKRASSLNPHTSLEFHPKAIETLINAGVRDSNGVIEKIVHDIINEGRPKTFVAREI